MAEYIERNEFYNIEKLLDTDVVRKSKTASWLMEQFLHDIQAHPAADVVPVVRCRECIYHKNERKDILFCDNFERDMLPDDFCSVGERREG